MKAKENNKRKRVLVLAVADGFGVWGAQLARLAGAEAVRTCRVENVNPAGDLEATEVLVCADDNERVCREWRREDYEFGA